MPSAPPRPTAPPRTTETDLEMPTVRRVLVAAGRMLRLRCPNCGSAPVLTRWRIGVPWGAIRDRCSTCGFRFERSDDRYFGGAMLVNLVVAELTFAVAFVGAVLLTWPEVPWDALTYGGAAAMLLLPVLFFPLAKVLWLSLDVLVRPVAPHETQP